MFAVVAVVDMLIFATIFLPFQQVSHKVSLCLMPLSKTKLLVDTSFYHIGIYSLE